MIFNEIKYDSMKEHIFCGTHESGLRVFVLPKTGFTKNYAIYATAFGSINNTFVPLGEDEVVTVPDGIAHFLEHKMFEEETGTNIFDEFARLGANANAFTSSSMTAYLFSATDFFYENLEVLLGYVNRPYFTPENIEKEQGIIGQEIRMYDDSPDWQVYIGVLRGLYQKHTARLDIAGTVESIAQIDQQAMYRCYNTYYHPSNMCLFVAGNVEPDKVGTLVEKQLAGRTIAPPVKEFFPEEPEAVCAPVVEKKMNVAMPQFVLAFKDNEVSDKDRLKHGAEAELLCDLIAGESTDFYQSLYKEGLINEGFSGAYEGDKSFGFATFYGESKNPMEVKNRIMERIAQMKAEGVNKEDLERMKRQNIGRFIRGLDRVEDIANVYISHALMGEDYMQYPEALASVTPKDLDSLIARLFKEESATISIVWPID